MRIFRLVALAVFTVIIFSACSKLRSERDKPYVVMVSLDAFRWDYDSIYGTPVLDDIARKGVTATRLIPSFPTKTFPNHYTIATGLYPDHHGLVNNSFYAPDLDLVYRIGDRAMVSNGAFYGGEPVWVTARKQGMKSASFYWVGSEAPVQGIQPDYWKPYDDEVPFGDRVDTVLKWLSMPINKRPHLVTLYFEEPDAVSHGYGPVSPETAAMVRSLDSLIGVLRTGLGKLPNAADINLIVLSDHGMTEVDNSRYNYIFDTLPQRMVKRIYGGNPVWAIEPAEGKSDSLLILLNVQRGMKAWKRNELPAHLHYGTHLRIPEILLVADPGWTAGLRPEPRGDTRGDHGYDWRCRDMHSIFYAEGPAFKKGFSVDTLYNVDIYNIVTGVLGLVPAPNDGNPERIAPLFNRRRSPL
ncbi:MAG TPA: ectonucleotide pyrophosphatase/phosphodiesterase [Bacteroidales bacterium]|jgi:alkaline phosphatase D|nr:alkaline phosphatase family protein [Bacteroidales bacterium]MDI9532320.1 ectonucleotide pyrophosphatase/phosphodiesterase [Bacteroidota bacterium]OPZ54969.1 MAG: Type I phosphodiesterase / nucleotide pyrophosphatase [Bacteroidetes bacterium ADurb.BinA012]MBP8708498.1 alkaline phosphatase family protein [Bacteroidales bacterium]HHU99580.1 alkaline phosphatase family protein [Bacteroidales bacterium]